MLAAIISLIISFFLPLIGFFTAWVSGWLIQIIMGTWFVDTLAYLNINLPVEKLPFLFGVIGAFATLFFFNSPRSKIKED